MEIARIVLIIFCALGTTAFVYVMIKTTIKHQRSMRRNKKEYEKRKEIRQIVRLFDKNYMYPPGGIDKKIYINDLKKHLEEKRVEQKYIDYAINLLISSSIITPESTN